MGEQTELECLPATDTGQVTGLQFMEDDSETIINYSSEFGDYQSKLFTRWRFWYNDSRG